MKSIKTILLLSTLIFVTNGCVQKTSVPEPKYYKNLFTEEIFEKDDYYLFRNNLYLNNIDSIKGKTHLNIKLYDLEISNDSIIRPFKYDVRIGKEYVVRADAYQKIGSRVSPKTLQTITGETIQIGGENMKPMLINLWFVQCPGCIAEMPALNRLKEKYEDTVEFIAITFQSEKQISNFLEKIDYNFKHVGNAEDFIKIIGTTPYPENIFIDKQGYIRYIEQALSDEEYFEAILEELIKELD